METNIIIAMKQYLRDIEAVKYIQESRMNDIAMSKPLNLKKMKVSGEHWYYYGYRPGEEKLKYLGTDKNNDVNNIKEIRYLEKSITLIDSNINTIKRALGKIAKTNYDSVNLMLPKTYRGARIGMESGDERSRKWKESAEALKARREVYRPEDLKNRTDDGTYVRSKSEMIIYNYLLSIGVTFVYELPMRIQNRFVVPDFTLLSEADYETEIIIEHQGLMEMDSYRNRFGEKVYMYLNAGYVPGNDIFFSFDSSDGGFDKRPIEVIVKNFIRPSS